MTRIVRARLLAATFTLTALAAIGATASAYGAGQVFCQSDVAAHDSQQLRECVVDTGDSGFLAVGFHGWHPYVVRD